MRMTLKDVDVTPWTHEEMIDSEGFAVRTWTLDTANTFRADVQSLGPQNMAIFREFGLDDTDPNSRVMFADLGATAIGAFLQVAGINYEVKGRAPWYDHDEYFLFPYGGIA